MDYADGRARSRTSRSRSDDRQDIAAIVDALTKKNTISGKAARLSDSLDRILDAPPEATLVKLCDRIDNLLDSADRNGGFTKRYLASTDELIGKLQMRASLYGYEPALSYARHNPELEVKNRVRFSGLLHPVDQVDRVDQRLDRGEHDIVPAPACIEDLPVLVLDRDGDMAHRVRTARDRLDIELLELEF